MLRPTNFNSSDSQVVRVAVSDAVDSGLIPSRVSPMTFKLVFTVSLFDALHQRAVGQCGEKAGKFTCSAIRKSN